MARCMACDFVLQDRDFIIDEQGELCSKCLGVVNTTVYPTYPIDHLLEDDE